MKFTKMHGLGNDYVYVNGFVETVDHPGRVARVVSDRHFGVGGDGLILILPPEAGIEADVRMRMFNADGSEGEMCGNGVRCVAKYAWDHGLARRNPLRVQTERGVLLLALHVGPYGKVERVTVDMDEPILDSTRIPVALPASRVVDHPLPTDGFGLDPSWQVACGLQGGLTGVSMGNPHVVLFCQDVDRVPLERVGPAIERHAIFPRRTNVHFAQVIERGELRMRTWERGSGITLACGTGACAVGVAGALTARTERSVLVHLPGGDLQIEWRTSDGHVQMTGPATEVFHGEWLGPLPPHHGAPQAPGA